MSSFVTIDQKLEMDKLLKIIRVITDRTIANPTFSIAQFRALLRIYRNEPVQVGEFKRTYKIGASRLSRFLDALTKLGLITRARDPKDGRKKFISMTDEGRLFVEAVLQVELS